MKTEKIELGIMYAEFIISGISYIQEEISNLLNIDSTYIENNSSWVWKSEPISCISTDEPIKTIINTFSSKVKIIQTMCVEMNLQTHIKLYVEIIGGDLPDPVLSFTPESIIFLESIQSDIEIVMINWPTIPE